MPNNFFDAADVGLLTTYTPWRGKFLRMKQKRTILFCCFVLAVGLSSCQNSEIPQGRIVHPITQFLAYNTIVQTDHDVFLFGGGDSQNFRLWIDSCPIIEEVDFDISSHWNYKVIFCDTEDIIVDNSIYYIPHTATTHVVYIDEEDNIIQYDNVAYSVKPPDVGRLSFYDGVRAFLIPVSNEQEQCSLVAVIKRKQACVADIWRMPRGVLSAGGACPAPTEAERRPHTHVL